MRIIILVLLYFSFQYSLNSSSFTDEQLVNHISDILLVNYDKKPTETLMEKILKDVGKKSYIKMLEVWKKSYNEIDKAEIVLNPTLKLMIKKVERDFNKDEVDYLYKLWDELLKLSLRNFSMYLDAVKSNPLPKDIKLITCDYIDQCMLSDEYYQYQVFLYEEEARLKDEILQILMDERVKNKLYFEIYFYNLINKIRKKTIDRLLSNYSINSK